MTYNLDGMCIVEFYGDSCASCHAVMPVLSALSAQFGYKFYRVNVEDEQGAAEQFGISRVPTAVLMDDGKEFARFSGYQPPEILEVWIEAKTQEHNQSKT